MLKLHIVTQYTDFHGHDKNHSNSRKSQHMTGKSHMIISTWLSYSAKKCYNNWSQLCLLTPVAICEALDQLCDLCPWLTVSQIQAYDSSFKKYKAYADIRGGSLRRERQIQYMHPYFQHKSTRTQSDCASCFKFLQKIIIILLLS